MKTSALSLCLAVGSVCLAVAVISYLYTTQYSNGGINFSRESSLPNGGGESDSQRYDPEESKSTSEVEMLAKKLQYSNGGIDFAREPSLPNGGGESYSQHLDQTNPDPEESKTTSEVDMLAKKLEYYHNKIYAKVHSSNEKCTMVMQTYRRAEILPKVIKNYCTIIDVFHKFLIIWNEVGTPIPESVTNAAHNCSVPVTFIHPKENIITNRYLAREEIETDCVCITDDDRIVFKEDVEFGFDVWKNFRDRHVGFIERTFSLGPKNSYLYGVHDTKEEKEANLKRKRRAAYAILLPAAYFLHKAYLEQYFDPMMVPTEAVEYVIKYKNCEDILLSAVITKFLQDTGHAQCGVVKVGAKDRIDTLDGDPSLKHRGGLGSRGNHYNHRNECLNRFAKMFGYLPLQKASFIIKRY